MRRFLALLGLWFLSVSLGQMVVINGQALPGARSDLVSGYSYAPATELASIISADLIDEGDSLSYAFNGQVMSFSVANSASEALINTSSLRFNGQLIASTAALRTEDAVFIPVRSFIDALGGSIDYIPQENSVLAVTPRASLKQLEFKRIARTERLSFTFSALSPVSQSYFPDERRLRFVFGHLNPVNPWQGRGDYSDSIELRFEEGQATLDLLLRPDVTYDSFSLSLQEGFQFNLDLFEGQAQSSRSLIVQYDPESFALASLLPEATAGFEVRLVSGSDASLLYADTVMVLLSASDLREKSFNVYYPESYAPPYLLEQALALEPALAQRLNPSLSGEADFQRGAESFARRLSLNSGYQLLTISAVPLLDHAISQAYWVLELSPDLLADASFQSALKRTLAEVMAQ